MSEGGPVSIELVPAKKIERLVGARRHTHAHLGRAVTEAELVEGTRTMRTARTTYILHSQACKDSGIDLRDCGYSRALALGIDSGDWVGKEDQVVTLMHAHGYLMPDDDGPDDIVYLAGEEAL